MLGSGAPTLPRINYPVLSCAQSACSFVLNEQEERLWTDINSSIRLRRPSRLHKNACVSRKPPQPSAGRRLRNVNRDRLLSLIATGQVLRAAEWLIVKGLAQMSAAFSGSTLLGGTTMTARRSPNAKKDEAAAADVARLEALREEIFTRPSSSERRSSSGRRLRAPGRLTALSQLDDYVANDFGKT